MSTHPGTSAPRTIGVEQEFLLVDPADGRPVAAAEAVLAAAEPLLARNSKDKSTPPEAPDLVSEVKQEQIEVVTPPASTLDELRRSIIDSRRITDKTAQRFGVRAVALATSVLPVDSHTVRGERYKAIHEQFGRTLKEQLTCGYHVHVSITSDEEGVAVLDRIRPWLSVLLALSANSPFWKGADSGYASYRYQAWRRWPTAGPYDVFGSAAAYRRRVDSLVETGVLLDTGMIYFDARLCTHYPTVEVRVSDVCTDPEHAVVIAGLVRALVETAAREWANGVAPEATPTAVLELAMWSASRYGVSSNLLNPLLGEPQPARVVVDALLAHVEPALRQSGDIAFTQRIIDEIFQDGTGADMQRRTMRRTGSAREVVAEAIDRTHRTTEPVDAPT